MSAAFCSTACASISTWRPPGVDESRFTALIGAKGGQVEWEIADRFRLLKQKGATEELFARYRSYYRTVATQINDAGTLETWWDAGAARYPDDYLRVDHWTVRLNAPFADDCTWRIGTSPPEKGRCKGHLARVGAGETSIDVHPVSNEHDIRTIRIRPRDVLIVSLGDSYASGEGVPDVRRNWFSSARWMDERCHRSLFSGPGLAALMYAMLNPHVSVTHLTFACSGAKLTEGIVSRYPGLVPPRGAAPLPPQVEALETALSASPRKIDYLTISAGGNDIGFGDIVTAAVFHGTPIVKQTIQHTVESGIRRVEEARTPLKARLVSMGIHPPETGIFVTEYPNPTHLWKVPAGAGGLAATPENACGRQGESVIPFAPGALARLGVAITPGEIKLMDDEVAARLRGVVRDLAQFLGASPVDGIDREFGAHGYCAPGLSLPNGRVRWINTVLDARIGGFADINGAMHPNIRGQDSYARHILEAIRNAECEPGRMLLDDEVRAPLCASDQWNRGLPGYGSDADAAPEAPKRAICESPE